MSIYLIFFKILDILVTIRGFSITLNIEKASYRKQKSIMIGGSISSL